MKTVIFLCFVIGCNAVSYLVDEERDPNVVLGNVGNVISEEVTDDMLREMRYSLLTDSDHLDKFGIEERSGSLYTTSRLDRETMCPFRVTCVVQLRVGATSGSYYKTINVDVLIMDVNDNAPTFQNSSMTLSISEGSTLNSTFPILSASDADMGQNNSIQSYEIVPNTGFFALDIHPKIDGTSDLSLRLIKTLDREDRDNYVIYVKAKDGGNPPKSGTLTVNISVTDINDNAPTFTQSVYNTTIQEDIPLNTVVMRVSANDRDTGKNAEVTYKFSVRQAQDVSIYKISETSGEISVIGQPEYDPSKPYYSIIVEASDNSPTARKSSQAQVLVYINDTNNNAPEITINLLSNGQNYAVIKENANMGDVAAHISVKDEDTGINGQVTCTLNNDYFRLQELPNVPNEYKVVVKSAIDREEKIEHVVTINCQDGGSPSLNSTASFIVQVLDENDNAPMFTNNVYIAQIDENSPVQSIIVKVSATDPDQGPNGQVRYYLGPEAQTDFTMNPTEGIIRTKVIFDREVQSTVNFTVLAMDGGNPVTLTATATVQLRINDENDVTPKFNKSHWEFVVREEINSTSIGFLKAYDNDAGDNGRITFYMKSEDLVRVPFTVSPYGEIQRTARLDREQKERYHFVVIARDNGVHTRSNATNVTVILEDINDNAPAFIFPNTSNSTVSIVYTAVENSLVTTISATDRDFGDNAELTYGIIGGNDDGLFKIDKFSGEILLARRVFIHEIRIYDLIVTAEDSGLQEQRSTRQPLSVHVKFVNTSSVASLAIEEQPQNLIIAIAISAVTVVISIAIIAIICVLRKMDMRKHNYPAKNIEEMKIMENLARNSSNRSSSSRGSHDQMMPSAIYKHGKKEVSFSLDEDDNNLSYSFPSNLSDTNPSMMTFKSTCITSPLTVQLPQHHSREGSTLSDTKAKELNRIESLRYQQRILQSKSPSSKWQQQVKFPDVTVKEDNHSDMSEESTTGDSGRGGSEEDVRSSGLSHPSESTIERSRSSMSSQFSPMDISGISSGSRLSSALKQPSLTTFGHGSKKKSNDGILSTFPRNSSLKHSTQHNVRQPNPESNQNSKLQRLHSEHYPPNQRPTVELPRVPSDIQTSKTYLLDHNLHSPRSRHLNLPLSGDDTIVSESCNTTVRDDDDVTTTSGSYTINPDDLCNEIDELFFKPSDTVV